MSGVTSIYATYAGQSTPLDHEWSLDLHQRLQYRWEGGGGRSRISDITSQGPVIDVFKIGDGRS
jgi:hypothetical protein